MNKKNYYYKGLFNDIVSSIILIFVAYIIVLYVSIGSTSFIAFSHKLSFPISIYGVDFEKSISGNESIWDLPENVMVIFSFSPLILFSLSLLALVGIKFFKNKALSLLCFWIAFLSLMRLFGDFIFGHIFNLWASNLVSDFMGITHPSLVLKLVFIFINIFFAFLSSLLFIPSLKYFYDPHKDDIRDSIIKKIIIPLSSLVILSLLWISPEFSINELSITILSLLSGLFLSYKLSRVNLNIDTSVKRTRNFTIRLRARDSIIILILLILFKILLDRGIYISSYRFSSSQLDTLLFIVLITSLIIFILFILCINSYYKIKKKKKDKIYKLKRENIEQEVLDEDILKGSKWDYMRHIKKSDNNS